MTDEQRAYWMAHKITHAVTGNHGHLTQQSMEPRFTWTPLDEESSFDSVDTQAHLKHS